MILNKKSFLLIILACNNSYAEDVTFCNNNEDLQKCIDNAPTRTVSLLEGVYLTNGIHIGSNTTFIIPENTTLKLSDDAELDGAAFGGDANFVIASLGKPKQLIENVHLVINGEVDGNKGVHVYEQGGVEGIDWKWVKNSTISGSGVVHSANGDGIDLDAVHNSKISGLTVRDNGDSGIHFGSPRPIMPSTNNIVIGVTSINNGFRIGKSGFDLSWPNPDGAIYVNCVAIDNYRNYKMEATGGAIYNSSSINNGGVIKEDYFGDVGYALVNGKDLTSSNFISMRTKILIKRDIRKLLGMSYHSYLDGLEY